MKHVKLYLLATMLLLGGLPSWAQSFSGSGTGTENDPYLIFNPIQLNEVRNFLNNPDVWFKVMFDIDLEEWLADNNPSQGWQPIGTQSSPFKGHFLGQGHKITGLFINRPSTDNVGFFGQLSGADVSNLSLYGESIEGGAYTGSLAGLAGSSSSISNCHTYIPVTGGDFTGGMIGCVNNCSVINCSSIGDVSGVKHAGGFVGQAWNSTISDCSTTGNVTATDNYAGGGIGSTVGATVTRLKTAGSVQGIYNVGGIAGGTSSSSSSVGGVTLNQCTFEGSVSGSGYVAGVIGYATAAVSINDCSSVGDIMGLDWTGGAVGYAKTTSLNITGVYAIGDITAENHVGGLVGETLRNRDVYRYIYSYRGYPWKDGSGPGYYDRTIYSVGQVVTWEGKQYEITKVEKASSSSYDFRHYYYVSETHSSHYVYYYEYNGNYYTYRYEGIRTDDWVMSDNYYCGDIAGKNYVGGLIGNGESLTVNTCYAYSSLVTGYNHVGGVFGSMVGTSNFPSSVTSCVANVQTVNAKQSNVGRVYGSVGDYVTIGANGTATENKGLATAKLTLNGLLLDMPDNLQNGTNVGSNTLKLRATYTGIGWNFSNWKILETESFPYKEGQCAPPVFSSSLTSGATVVSGKSANGGTVYLSIGDKQYHAETNANTWSIVVDPLQAGDIVKAYVANGELIQSYIVKQTVQFKGKGTKAEPYEIYTANDLSRINSYSYYKLMNDIDLTEWISVNSPNKGWVPIGLSGGGSMRQLDGDNHRVTGLWIDEDMELMGLIANTSNATICNLTLYTASGKCVKGTHSAGALVGKAVATTFSNVIVNADVQGQNYVGGIAGYCQNNTYNNCKFYGSVSGQNYVGGISSGYGDGSSFEACVAEATVFGHDYVGGLVGITTASTNICHTSSTVTGNNYVGGLIGQAGGAVSECYTQGTVTATNNISCYAGGITGVNQMSITDCYSNAEVHSGVIDGAIPNTNLQQVAGGIAGYNYGKIERCFASGNIEAVKFGAGIVGYNDGENATTSKCYAISERINVSNESGVVLRVIGGFKNGAPNPGTDNYALKTMAVSINNVAQQVYDDLLHGFSKTKVELMQGSTYSSNGWDMSNVWNIDEGNGYPYLRVSQTTTTHVATALNVEESVEIFKGDTHPIQVNILPNTASANLQWTSSDEQVVTVNEQGVVTGVEVGQAAITATTLDGSNLSATCVVTVKPHAVSATGIVLDRESLTMTVGQVSTLLASVLPENADNREVTWNSTDATIASVNSAGEVRAIKTGTTQIYATTTDGTNLSATCEVTVVDAAGNILEADDFSAGNGSTVDLYVRLTNEAAISALQADIFLPDGVTIATEDGDYLVDLTTRKGRDHTASVNQLANGALRLLIGSPTSKPFSGNEGDLFIIHLVVDENAQGGDYNIELRNVVLSATDATVYYAPDLNVKLTVIDYIKGDANGDHTVNVGDYVTVGNYILNLDPQPFVFKAADVDENSTINVGDMVGVANIILNYLGTSVIKAPEMPLLGTYSLTASAEHLSNDSYLVTLALSNTIDLTAMQMDIILPAGLSIVEANLSDRASSSHQLTVSQLDNGNFRLLAASSTNRTFTGNEGNLLKMVITGKANDGVMTLSNILLAEPNAICHDQDDISLQLGMTAIDNAYSQVKIYAQGNAIVVDSPSDNMMQIVMANGMSITRKVNAGHNVYHNIGHGLVIIKVADSVAKFKL